MASRSLFRLIILSFTLLTLVTIAFLYREQEGRFGIRDRAPAFQISFSRTGHAGSTVVSKNATERLDLTTKQCRDTFPGLTKDVDDNVVKGQFALQKSDADYQGLVQGRILDRKLYILSTAADHTPMILHQRTAVLQQLHRALLTAPEAVPDTYFAFVVNDNMKNNSWSFARPNKESTYNTWLIPSFAFWSWPASNLGTMDDVLHRIITLESTAPFREKVDKVVWRGTPWFNPVGHAHLRQSLLGATKDKDWADVQALNVSKNGEESTNGLKIEEFCRYKYVVYTEGVTYSGRLPFHQACESVLLTAPLTYLTTTAWMMKPIDAEELMSQYSYEDDSSSPSSKTTSTSPSHFTPLLPLVSDYRLANAIYVTPDFSNLERTIDFLRQHPEVARRIARNQRDVVAQKGYLSPAAEACYWRSLVGGWAASAVPDNSWGEEKGERFESWILKEVEGRSRGRGRQGSQNGPGIG